MPRRYVQCRDPHLNEQIDSQLELITKKILKNIAGVRSIFVVGGFGKGEGSVRISEDRTVECLRDFDIVCVIDHKPRLDSIDKLLDKIYNSLGLTNPEHSLFRQKGFAIDLTFLQKKDLIFPDIYFYDLKAASQLLWGEDVRNIIPFSKKDVPFSSGLRLLFEKVAGLLGHFSIGYLNGRKLTLREKELIISECHKSFIEMGTALCILAREYEPKYEQRALKLEKIYSTHFPELAKILPELPEKVKEYTDLKLSLHKSIDEYEDPLELWFSSKRFLQEILGFYLEKYTNKSLSDWRCLPEIIESVARIYYDPFLDPIIRARFGFANKFTVGLAGFLYQGLTNLEYIYALFVNQKRIHFQPLKRWSISPSLKYFSAGAMLLFSLKRDGTLDNQLLRRAAKELENCIPSNISSLEVSEWEGVKNGFLEAHMLYKGYHFVK